MGSGNTKNGLRQDTNIAAINEKKTRQQESKDVNKTEHKDINKNVSNFTDPIRKKSKDNDESDNEEAQLVEDVRLKLSERGFNAGNLIAHFEKTPKYFEYFISLYEAIKVIDDKINGDDFLDISRQVTVFSSSYSKVKKKVVLGSFLAEIGFARIFKQIYIKLDSAFPDLLTYDRELDDSLKKSSDVEKSIEDESTNIVDGNSDNLKLQASDNEPIESSSVKADNEPLTDQASVSPMDSSGKPTGSDKSIKEPNKNATAFNLQPTNSGDKHTEPSASTVETKYKNLTEYDLQPINSSESESKVSRHGSTQESNKSSTEDGLEHSNSSNQPTVSDTAPTNCNDKPANETTGCALDPVNVAEKKPKPSNPLLKAQDLFNKIMTSAINYTDACDSMNLALSKEGVVEILVEAVTKLKDCTGQHVKYMNEEGGLKKKTVRGGMLTKVMGTLHNLAKRIPTRPNFHNCNAVKKILPLIDDVVNRFAIDALLIVAYLIDEENNNLIMANEGPIKYLISLINKATKKTTHKYLGYTNSELAQGLAQIAINDNNKKQIVASGAIPVLNCMIEEAKSDKESIAAAKALWMLAFDEDNREVMKRNKKCVDLLSKLKESENDQTKKAASGALWEIEKKQNMATSFPSDEKSSSGTTNHVMISYQWDVQKTLIQVKDQLQATGYRVWMDLEQMGGSTLEAMARAVENSAVVLICVSQKYKESTNCRSEAEYAFQLHKDIIPLMMESNYRPDGWLGMIMGSKLWIDFSQQHISKVEASVKDLIKELGIRGKGDSEIVPVRSVDVVDAKPTVDISGWNTDDIKSWMKSFGFVMKNKNAVDGLTGTVLTRLHTFRNEVSLEFYYSSLKEDLGFTRMIDVLIFSDELKKLLS